jgi:hypothetical protein
MLFWALLMCKALEMTLTVATPFGYNHTFAYVFRKRVEPRWKEREKKYLHNASSVLGFQKAVHDLGMAWNSLGIGFPWGWDFSSSLMHDILEPHFFYSGIRDQPTLQKIMIEMDHRRAPFGSESDAADATDRSLLKNNHIYQGLRKDGFALIDDWGIDIDALSREVDEALAGSRSVVRRGAAVLYNGPLSSLTSILANKTVRDAALHYLGNDAELSGYESLRLTDGLATESQYISGYWHHDRCGHRLKAFIFLHDVHRVGGRPTEVARGSQNTLFHSYHDNWEARFEDTYVQANYDTVAMVGQRGGGFVFDTNTIHRGVVNGNRSRTVVILEFNRVKKSAELRARGERAIPCPSGSMHKVRLPCFSS